MLCRRCTGTDPRRGEGCEDGVSTPLVSHLSTVAVAAAAGGELPLRLTVGLLGLTLRLTLELWAPVPVALLILRDDVDDVIDTCRNKRLRCGPRLPSPLPSSPPPTSIPFATSLEVGDAGSTADKGEQLATAGLASRLEADRTVTTDGRLVPTGDEDAEIGTDDAVRTTDAVSSNSWTQLSASVAAAAAATAADGASASAPAAEEEELQMFSTSTARFWLWPCPPCALRRW